MDDTQNYNSDSVDWDVFWNEFENLTNILESDLDEIECQLTASNNQLWRRTFCRTFFAYLEGQTHALQQLFLFSDSWTVDPDTEYRIRNQKPLQNKDGSVKMVPAYLPFVQNVKLVFKVFASAARIEPIISDNDKSWELLGKAVSIRNRIVHPKKSVDLFISDDEIQLIKYVGRWYLLSVAGLLQKRAEVDMQKIKSLDKIARERFGSPLKFTDVDLLMSETEEENSE